MLTIKMMQEAAHENSKSKGFWEDEESLLNRANAMHGVNARDVEKLIVSRKIALIHSEASEGLEALRESHGFGNLAEELADVIIRVGDLAQWLGIDLETAVRTKMQKNAARPTLHGKAF
jgi:NTP pyrophosphatase (non-canonical NTP hydrolase)